MAELADAGFEPGLRAEGRGHQPPPFSAQFQPE